MITISDSARNSLQITRKGIVLVRLYYGDETAGTDFIAISSGLLPSDWAEGEYRSMLLSPPVTGAGVDIYSHKFKASEVKLEISNGDYHPGVKFSDLINDTTLGAGSDIGFENRECQIRMLTPGVTTWADCVQMFKGKVRDIAHTDNVITFSVQDDREIIHSEIGTVLTDSDAVDTIKGLPQSSRGKVRPEVWGDLLSLLGNDSKALDTLSKYNNFPALLYLGLDSSGDHRWFVANHVINEINAEGDDSEQQQIWGIDSDLNRFVRLSSTFTLVQNTSAGCIISHPNEPIFIDYWYADGPVTQTSLGTVTAFPAATGPAIDGDFSTKLSGSIDNGSAAGDYVQLAIVWNPYDDQSLPDADISGVNIVWYGLLTLGGGAVEGDFSLKIDAIGVNVKPTSGSYPDLRLFDSVSGSAKSEIGGAPGEAFKLLKLSAVAAETAAIDVYEFYKSVKYTRHKNLSLYFGGKGREYSFTRGGHDEATSGNLIKNPAGVIEDVYLNLLARVAADIDTDAFDTASNTLTGWEFSFALAEIVKSLEFIQGLAQESRSFVWLAPDGTIKMKVIDDTYASSDRVIDFESLFSHKFTRTKPQNIYTAVDVLYGDRGDGQHNANTGISEDTTMQTRYNLTEAQSTLIFESKHIGASATAILLQAFLLAHWKQPHNLINFAAGLDQIDLDIGDVIEFSNVAYKIFGEDITDNTTTRAGQTIYKYWWIYDVKRSITGIKAKAFQLHDLS